MTSLFLALVLAAAGHQEPVQSAGEARDRAELLRLEGVWNDAHLRGDGEALDRLWAEELVVTVPSMQPFTKAQSMGVWRTGRMKFQRYETSAVRLQLHGEAAVVTGRLHRSRSINDRNIDDDWLFTKTYVRRAGKWQVVAFHASEAPK